MQRAASPRTGLYKLTQPTARTGAPTQPRLGMDSRLIEARAIPFAPKPCSPRS